MLTCSLIKYNLHSEFLNIINIINLYQLIYMCTNRFFKYIVIKLIKYII